MNVTSISRKRWIYHKPLSFLLLLSGYEWTRGWCPESLKDNYTPSGSLPSSACGSDTSTRAVPTSFSTCLSWHSCGWRDFIGEGQKGAAACPTAGTTGILGTFYLNSVAPNFRIWAEKGSVWILHGSGLTMLQMVQFSFRLGWAELHWSTLRLGEKRRGGFWQDNNMTCPSRRMVI